MWEKKLFLKINLLYRIINQGNLLNKTRKNVCKLVLKLRYGKDVICYTFYGAGEL